MSKKEQYFDELLQSLHLFIDKSFSYKSEKITDSFPDDCFVFQDIIGEYVAVTAVSCSDEAASRVSAKYSGIDLAECEGIYDEILSDFINLHNGRFIVNLSNNFNTECSLSPPVFKGEPASSIDWRTVYIRSYDSDFGVINFIIAETENE